MNLPQRRAAVVGGLNLAGPLASVPLIFFSV